MRCGLFCFTALNYWFAHVYYDLLLWRFYVLLMCMSCFYDVDVFFTRVSFLFTRVLQPHPNGDPMGIQLGPMGPHGNKGIHSNNNSQLPDLAELHWAAQAGQGQLRTWVRTDAINNRHGNGLRPPPWGPCGDSMWFR